MIEYDLPVILALASSSWVHFTTTGGAGSMAGTNCSSNSAPNTAALRRQNIVINVLPIQQQALINPYFGLDDLTSLTYLISIKLHTLWIFTASMIILTWTDSIKARVATCTAATTRIGQWSLRWSGLYSSHHQNRTVIFAMVRALQQPPGGVSQSGTPTDSRWWHVTGRDGNWCPLGSHYCQL